MLGCWVAKRWVLKGRHEICIRNGGYMLGLENVKENSLRIPWKGVLDG